MRLESQFFEQLPHQAMGDIVVGQAFFRLLRNIQSNKEINQAEHENALWIALQKRLGFDMAAQVVVQLHEENLIPSDSSFANHLRADATDSTVFSNELEQSTNTFYDQLAEIVITHPRLKNAKTLTDFATAINRHFVTYETVYEKWFDPDHVAAGRVSCISIGAMIGIFCEERELHQVSFAVRPQEKYLTHVMCLLSPGHMKPPTSQEAQKLYQEYTERHKANWWTDLEFPLELRNEYRPKGISLLHYHHRQINPVSPDVAEQYHLPERDTIQGTYDFLQRSIKIFNQSSAFIEK